MIEDSVTYFRKVVTEELMSVVWHPSRVEKWKYLDEEFNEL